MYSEQKKIRFLERGRARVPNLVLLSVELFKGCCRVLQFIDANV